MFGGVGYMMWRLSNKQPGKGTVVVVESPPVKVDAHFDPTFTPKITAELENSHVQPIVFYSKTDVRLS